MNNINSTFDQLISRIGGVDGAYENHNIDENYKTLNLVDKKIGDLDGGIVSAGLRLFNGSSVDALDVQKSILDRRSFIALASSVSQTLRNCTDRLMQSLG
jgi:hypothetical protein